MRRLARAALFVLPLAGCASDPPVLVVPSYTENVTYNTTVSTAPGASTSPPAPPPPPADPPAPPGAPPPLPVSPPSPPPSAPSAPSPPAARPVARGPSTGLKVCDEYIDRVESCSADMLARSRDGGDAVQNMQQSLELMRRTFRRTLKTHPEQRASLVDTCSTSLEMYNRSIASSGVQCDGNAPAERAPDHVRSSS